MVNKPRKLLSGEVDLLKYGFTDIEEICRETGWYRTVEYPQDVFDKFKEEYSEMVVQSCSISQFEINWRVFGRNSDN